MGHVNKWADDEECAIKMKVVFPPPVYGRFLSPPPARPDSDPLLFDGLVCGAWVIWFACVCPGAVAWLMVFKHWRDIRSEGVGGGGDDAITNEVCVRRSPSPWPAW